MANHSAHLVAWSLTALLLPASAVARPQDKVNPTGAQVKAFLDRVNTYVDARKKLENDLKPVKPSDETSALEQHEKILADRIRASRQNAKEGDLFGAAAPLFKEILARDRENRGARDTGAALKEVPARTVPKVNAVYPNGAALATVPPLVLSNLPPLPDGLEYRFLGRDLILRDRGANLVVDFISEALPASR